MTIKNISIGENKWIHWIDIDRNSEVYEFDLLETKLSQFSPLQV